MDTISSDCCLNLVVASEYDFFGWVTAIGRTDCIFVIWADMGLFWVDSSGVVKMFVGLVLFWANPAMYLGHCRWFVEWEPEHLQGSWNGVFFCML